MSNEPAPAPAVIPASTATAEATPDSLADLFSRDPEGFSQQDLASIVTELRAQRARWAAALGPEGAKAPKTPKVKPSNIAPAGLDL